MDINLYNVKSYSLPPANEVWGKVIFSQACVKNSVHRTGAWFWGRGAWSQRGVPGPRRVPCPGVCLVPVVPGPGGGCLIPEGCLVPGGGVENSPCGMATAAAVRILPECILALNLRCGCNYHEHSCSFLAASKTQAEKLCAGYRLN